MFQVSSFKFRKGFTMIELIITIAILSFGIMGVYSAFSPIASLQRTISSRFIAAYLAQEGFEITRDIRNSNFTKVKNGQRIAWSEGLTNCQLGCQLDYKTATTAQTFENALKLYSEQNYLQITADGFYGYSQGTKTPFKRKVVVEQMGSPDTLKVTVTVMWDYNGKPFNFETEGYLYNYQ